MKSIQQKKLENNLYIAGICIPLILLAGFMIIRMFPDFFSAFYVPCVFYKLLGLYCPGCGGTRAALSLFKGKFVLSFLYHPLVLYTAVVYLWYMISHTIEKLSHGKCKIAMRYRDIYLWLALVILIINFAVKNIVLTASGTDILKMLDSYL